MKKINSLKLTSVALLIFNLGIALLIIGCNTKSKSFSNNNNSSNFDAKVDSILSLMTLDEKIGQLNLPGAGDVTTGQAKNSDIAKKIEAGMVGGLLNLTSVEKIMEVQKIAVEKSRLKIPLLFGLDVIHGYRTTFPIPLGL
ncbi:MAG: beta-glucosidase, partial [Flavobacteriaceae bacterium]|nr:beta-glucosidase [Flavobacteriaceae bacterium]